MVPLLLYVSMNLQVMGFIAVGHRYNLKCFPFSNILASNLFKGSRWLQALGRRVSLEL